MEQGNEQSVNHVAETVSTLHGFSFDAELDKPTLCELELYCSR